MNQNSINAIVKLCSSQMTNNIDAKKCCILLNQILECELPDELKDIKSRFDKAVDTFFDGKTTQDDARDNAINLFKNTEVLFRTLLYFTNNSKYTQIKNNEKGFYSVLKGLSLTTNRIDLKDKPEDFIGQPGYIEHVCRTYHFRNDESHDCYNWSMFDIHISVKSILITAIYTVHKHMTVLEDACKRSNFDIDISEYNQNLITHFEDNKYIDLNSTEILDRMVSEIVDNNEEDDDDNNEEKLTGRSGTVNELRKEIDEKRMILYGKAGTGKSTTLKYLAWKDATDYKQNNYNNIPILMNLCQMIDNSMSIKDYIVMDTKIPSETLEKLLTNGKINLFFDGLNEIPEYLKQMRIIELHVMLEKYKDTFFIFSNRPDDDIKTFADLPAFKILPLNDEQTEKYLLRNANEETIKIIKEATTPTDQDDDNTKEEKLKLKSIIKTPLILSRLIEVVDDKKKIPDGEWGIISEFLACLLERESKKQAYLFIVKHAKMLLDTIAFENFEKTKANSGIPRDVIVAYMKQSMNENGFDVDIDKYLDIFSQIGILEAKENNQYVFAHQSYIEYYHSEKEFEILGV